MQQKPLWELWIRSFIFANIYILISKYSFVLCVNAFLSIAGGVTLVEPVMGCFCSCAVVGACAVGHKS